jgi:hypothetical protein
MTVINLTDGTRVEGDMYTYTEGESLHSEWVFDVFKNPDLGLLYLNLNGIVYVYDTGENTDHWYNEFVGTASPGHLYNVKFKQLYTSIAQTDEDDLQQVGPATEQPKPVIKSVAPGVSVITGIGDNQGFFSFDNMEPIPADRTEQGYLVTFEVFGIDTEIVEAESFDDAAAKAHASDRRVISVERIKSK